MYQSIQYPSRSFVPPGDESELAESNFPAWGSPSQYPIALLTAPYVESLPSFFFVGEPTDFEVVVEVFEAAWAYPPQYPQRLLSWELECLTTSHRANFFVAEPTDLEVFEAAWVFPPQYPAGLLTWEFEQGVAAHPSLTYQADPSVTFPEWLTQPEYPIELLGTDIRFYWLGGLAMPIIPAGRLGIRTEGQDQAEATAQTNFGKLTRKSH